MLKIIDCRDGTKRRRTEMINSRSTIVIFFGASALLFGSCAWSIFSGYVAEPSKNILIATEILALSIVGFIVWIYLGMKRGENMSIEEKIQGTKDSTFLELRDFMRESLMPINFKEKQEHLGIGYAATYTRGQFLVELGKEARDEYYYFRVSSQLTVDNDQDQGPYVQPSFDFLVDSNAGNGDSFKKEVKAKLSEWLVEQNIS